MSNNYTILKTPKITTSYDLWAITSDIPSITNYPKRICTAPSELLASKLLAIILLAETQGPIDWES